MTTPRNAQFTCPVCQRQKPLREAVHGGVVHGPVVDLIAKANPSWTADQDLCVACLNRFRAEYVEDALEEQKGELSALEADGKGKIISSPRVLTGDKVEALIEQGVELPYQQATSSGATSVTFRKANLSLKVKPQITPDGNIIMTLDVNKDEPGATTPAGISISTKHVKTEVLIENGGTVVIGGIYDQRDRTDNTRVPFFGDLPYIGFLFRNQVNTSSKTELLVFVTPRIMTERMTVR